jgi:hypothetical protein
LEAALREQRSLVRKLGEAERSLGGSTAARSAARKAAAEQEYWSEEAGRRFAMQQEELVALREQNAALQQHMAAAVSAETAARYEASIKELQQLVRFYEQRLTAAGGAAAVGMESIGAIGASASGQDAEGCCGSWLLETLTEGGACYLWERGTGRVMTDVPDGHWPRPVGEGGGASSKKAAAAAMAYTWHCCACWTAVQIAHHCAWCFKCALLNMDSQKDSQEWGTAQPVCLYWPPSLQVSRHLPAQACNWAARAGWMQHSEHWQMH